MWTNTQEGRAFIAELSKGVVSQVAPEELDLFDELAQDYFDDPTPPDAATPSGDDVLGFGMNEILVAATPAATAMASAVVGFIVQEALTAVSEESVTLVLKKLFKKDDEDTGDSPPPLNEAQLAQVKKLALEQAQTFGMDAAEAERMAAMLVGSLVTRH